MQQITELQQAGDFHDRHRRGVDRRHQLLNGVSEGAKLGRARCRGSRHALNAQSGSVSISIIAAIGLT